MIVILFFDFFLGSKSGISGIFGTFLADIGGFFLNELTKRFTSNLLYSIVFLKSIWPTTKESLYSLSFCFTFFLGAKSTIFRRFGTFLAHIGVFFLNQLPNQLGSNFFFSFSFFLRSLSFLLPFFLLQTLKYQAFFALF